MTTPAGQAAGVATVVRGGGATSFPMPLRPVIAWALYDFANTIFSFAVITRYFNEWIIEDRGNPDRVVSTMGLVVAAALLFTMPAAGALADRVGRRKPFLAAFTLGCIGATAAIGYVGSTLAALVVAGIAIFCFQQALAQYDPLLADVAPPERQGAVSGLGVGLGYVGVFVGLAVLSSVVASAGGDKQAAFLPTALLFLVFAVPLFLFVRERTAPWLTREGGGGAGGVASAGDHAGQPTPPHEPLAATIAGASRQLVVTARHIRSDYRDVARFLVGRFLYADALLTVIMYMTVYMNRVGDFSSSQKDLVLALSIGCAALGAMACGPLVGRVGPRRVLLGVLTMFSVTLAVAGITGSAALVWVLGPLVGVGLGGVWTSDRVFMMRMTPPAVRGEFFSIYNLVGKLSSGIGPFVIWGGSIWLLHERLGAATLTASRVALVALAASAAIGALVIRPLSDHQREWGATDPDVR